MSFTLTFRIPELELDLDVDAVNQAGGEAAHESMRVKGGRRGENLKNMDEAGLAGAQEEIARQADTRGIIKVVGETVIG